MPRINGHDFTVNTDEFRLIDNPKFTNLLIVEDLPRLEVVASLLYELSLVEWSPSITDVIYEFTNITHGGFIPFQLTQHGPFNKKVSVYISAVEEAHLATITANGFEIRSPPPDSPTAIHILYDASNNSITIEPREESWNRYLCATTSLYIPPAYTNDFTNHFRHYLDSSSPSSNNLNYDNLIHLCIIVKNGGALFKELLEDIVRQRLVDRWTILDTGSDDDTLQHIQEILAPAVKGTLYQEPFGTFKTTRNRCLELAGNTCKFNLMLDDTYFVEGDLRAFLQEVRGDQLSTSFSVFVNTNNIRYVSNRITKPQFNLKYEFDVHEIIQEENNTNVKIPYEYASILDKVNPEMVRRTADRLNYDLQILFQMAKKDPTNPRHYFYIAQTYNNMADYANAAEWYFRRYLMKAGFPEERFTSLFEFIKIKRFRQICDWATVVEPLYIECINEFPKRPEAYFFMGEYYTILGGVENKKKAYEYLKQAYIIGFPESVDHSIFPTISFEFIPHYLTELCYFFNNFELGYKACSLYFSKAPTPADSSYAQMMDWFKIYEKLIQLQNPRLVVGEFGVAPAPTKLFYDGLKKTIAIIADGGFTAWDGDTIKTTGLGGSESWVIETARHLVNKQDNYFVVVFCNCEVYKICDDGVFYIPINKYPHFISTYEVEHVIISRYSEYIPLSIKGACNNIHIILHDTSLTGSIIPDDPKIKNVFCLSQWHRNHFCTSNPIFTEKCRIVYHGTSPPLVIVPPLCPKPTIFIYSSFANRGLVVLLKMWPRIREIIPTAILHLFVDLENSWLVANHKEAVAEIKAALDTLGESIINHGWVNKKTLMEYWNTSAIWLYPCTFTETFCYTAMEAALSKTLVITNDKGGLTDTVGNRGIIIRGEIDEEWIRQALEVLQVITNNPASTQWITELVEANYKWAISNTWDVNTGKLMEYMGIPTGTPQTLPTPRPIKVANTPLEYIEYLFGNRAFTMLDMVGQYAIEIAKKHPDAKIFCYDEWDEYPITIKVLLISYIKMEKITTISVINEYDTLDPVDVVFVKNSIEFVMAWNKLKKGGFMIVNEKIENSIIKKVKGFRVYSNCIQKII